MSLISGSYSRACGGGGAPDCRGDMVENCLYDERPLDEAETVVARVIELVRGARRARAWRVGNRRFLVAVRTLRLMVDIVNGERGES